MENKCCVNCIYFKENEMYCIRKRKVVKNEYYCLHFVYRINRHSLENLMTDLLSELMDEM